MSQEAWPTPQEPSREPLPRVEDLPVAEQGYEQDSVRAAFDSFYRHAAQLDAALRTLEAVDSFHRQAAALRADLRALRSAGWTQQPWGPTPAYGYATRAPREGISPAVWRIAGEAAFLIAVAVGLGVAKVPWWVIVLVMAFAWLVVGTIEWVSSRDLWRAARPLLHASAHPVVEAGTGGRDDEALGWTAFEEAQEPSDAMTMIGSLPGDEAVGDDVSQEASGAQPREAQKTPPEADAVAQPEEAPVIEAPRRRWRRGPEQESKERDEEPLPEIPRHVRVLTPDERPDETRDPWEDEPQEDDLAGDREPALSAESEKPSRRLFRRR